MSKETKAPAADARDRKMSKGELISYGLGGVASTMPSQFKTSYAMNFMSDVAGLHVGAVGILNTLLIIWDAINDPIIGGIADRTNTKRFGKYRPHMIMGILLWAVIMVMLFTVPNFSETGMWVYYIVALLLYSVFYTQFTVPWQALNSAMTHDPQERNLMLTCRQYGGFIAGAVVGVITIPIVQSQADARTGWHISIAVVCVTMIITGLCAANGAKRVDYYNSLPTPEKVHLKSQLGLVVKNRAVICAALLLGTVTLVNTMSSALSLYYLRCVVDNLALKSIFSLVSLGISLVFIPFMPAMLKKFGKIKTVFIGMAIIAVQAIWLIFRREFATDYGSHFPGIPRKPRLRVCKRGRAGHDPGLHGLHRVEVRDGAGRLHQRDYHVYEEVLLQLLHHHRRRRPGLRWIQRHGNLPGSHRHDYQLKDCLSHRPFHRRCFDYESIPDHAGIRAGNAGRA